MEHPPERILGRHLVERVQAQRAAGAIPIEAEMLFLVTLLLADENGVVSRHSLDVTAPALLEVGFVEVRQFEKDDGYVRVRFVPHQLAPRR